MDITKLTSNIAFFIFTVILILMAWRTLNWVWFRPKRLERYLRQQGLAGNPYRFFHGDSKENAMMTREAASKPMKLSNDIAWHVMPYIDLTLQIYGKRSFIWHGPIPRLIIMEPQQIKEIFNKIDDYHKPRRNPLANLVSSGLVGLDGPKWALHRKVIAPAFHLQKVKLMVPPFYESCKEMVETWEKLAGEDGSCELDVCRYLEAMASDVICRTAFSRSYKEGKRILDLLRELVEHTIQLLSKVYIPGSRHLPTKTNKRIKKIDEEIRTLLMGVIDKREKAMRAGEATSDDLLGLLMKSNYRVMNENSKERGLSINEVMDECKLFYFSGQATTASLLVWTMVMLSKHPHWQERARNEVLDVFSKNRPDANGLNRLNVVTMILHEVLRLYPAAFGPTRVVKRETKLGDLTLPAGVEVFIPMIPLHHDHDLWGDDALEFKPERFANGVSEATNNQVSYIPFGWGPKICIGQSFALTEAKVAVATILQSFSFELSPSYTHAPVSIGTLLPKYGAYLILHRV